MEDPRSALPSAPVLPFAATYCQSPPMPCYSNGTYPIEPWAVEMVMTMPYEEGAAGVVMYLEAEATKRPAELAHQLRTVTGPTGQSLVERARACAAAHCGGHGRCMPLASEKCECYPGFVGPSCSPL